MQSIETYGFIAEYDEKNTPQYSELKDAIERLCRSAESYSKIYNKNPLIQYLHLENKMYITCGVINGHAEFGIYNKKNQDIVQYMPVNSYRENMIEAIYELKDRIEIIAKNPHVLKINPLKELWTDLFQQKGLIPNFDQQIEK